MYEYVRVCVCVCAGVCMCVCVGVCVETDPRRRAVSTGAGRCCARARRGTARRGGARPHAPTPPSTRTCRVYTQINTVIHHYFHR